jgi:hypothetical protein
MENEAYTNSADTREGLLWRRIKDEGNEIRTTPCVLEHVRAYVHV